MTILAPAVPRYAVSYGGFTLDETNGILITSEPGANDDSVFGDFVVEFAIRLLSPTGVDATDDAAFNVLVQAAETALRIPRQELKASLGAQVLRDWDFSNRTAFLIQPQLTFLEGNQHDYKYQLRVKCQYPGNVPSNARRRESTTRIGTSLRERRVCEITALWTADSTYHAAYDRYLNSGPAFFASYLPSNTTDEHGHTGEWVAATQNAVNLNDEGTLTQATHTFLEVFVGRRDSQTTEVTAIDGRRIARVPVTFCADATHSAFQNYNSNAGSFFDAELALIGNVAGGEWVQVDEEITLNDLTGTVNSGNGGMLTAVRVYHEVVSGLREYRVRTRTLPSQVRELVIEGVYYATTGGSAHANYNANISTLKSAVIGALSPAFTHYESLSVPKLEGYDTTGLRYFFTITLTELAQPQGPGGYDDANVVLHFLDLRAQKPLDAQSFTSSLTPTRLKTVTARFDATINALSSGGLDPVSLWDSTYRAWIVGLCATKLGAGVSAVEVVDENVGPSLDNRNALSGTLQLVVTGGGLLWLQITQAVNQFPGSEFWGEADGTPFHFHRYLCPPEKLLHREAIGEYVQGYGPPVLFDTGDNTVSGLGLIDTGLTAQESVNDQNSSSPLTVSDGWVIDRRASEPYSYTVRPTTRGDDFETVTFRQVENWRYVGALI